MNCNENQRNKNERGHKANKKPIFELDFGCNEFHDGFVVIMGRRESDEFLVRFHSSWVLYEVHGSREA
jgi:hypothetical protein